VTAAPRFWRIAANLRDVAAAFWCGYCLLTFRPTYAAFAVVTLVYLVMHRRAKWTIKDRDRVIACHSNRIRTLDEALSKCMRGRAKLKLIKKVVPS
jgi:hypothetical protein